MSNDDFPLIPAWEDMDFTANCTAWGNWLATWYLPNPWDPLETLDGGYTPALTLIDASVPGGIVASVMGANSSISMPMLHSKVHAWWSYHSNDVYEWDTDGLVVDLNTDSAFWQNVLVPGFNTCEKEACKAQAYTGNADITGPGIYTAYYMQLSLSTVYLVAFTAAAVRNLSRNRARSGRSSLHSNESPPDAAVSRLTLGRRTLNAFSGTLDSFLMSAVLMCIAMISAALYLAVEGYKETRLPETARGLPFSDSRTYNMVLSVTAAAFSTFPVLVLYALLSRRDRGSPDGGGDTPTNPRVWLRRAALFAIWVLLVVEVFLSPRGNSDYEDRHSDEQKADNWDQGNKRGGERYWQTMKAAQFLVIGLPLLWMVPTLFLTGGSDIPGVADRPWVHRVAAKPWVRRVRSVWELGVAWANLLIAWALLAYFSILREEIIETAGATDGTNSWGFGQILTLGTWLPIILEWLYIFIWGIEDSVNSRLPSGFEVKAREPHGGPAYVETLQHGQDDATLPFIKQIGSIEMVPLRKATLG